MTPIVELTRRDKRAELLRRTWEKYWVSERWALKHYVTTHLPAEEELDPEINPTMLRKQFSQMWEKLLAGWPTS